MSWEQVAQRVNLNVIGVPNNNMVVIVYLNWIVAVGTKHLVGQVVVIKVIIVLVVFMEHQIVNLCKLN